MTQLLERAIAEIRCRPDDEQDAIAARILDELADERLWDEAFARTQDKLAQLAEKVLEDIHDGRIRNTGFDAL